MGKNRFNKNKLPPSEFASYKTKSEPIQNFPNEGIIRHKQKIKIESIVIKTAVDLHIQNIEDKKIEKKISVRRKEFKKKLNIATFCDFDSKRRLSESHSITKCKLKKIADLATALEINPIQNDRA